MKNDNPKLPEKGIKVKINLVKVGIAILIFLTIAPFVLAFFQDKVQSSEIPLSQALTDLQSGKVDKVAVENDTLTFTYKTGKELTATKETNISFTEVLDRAHIDPSKVNYTVKDQTVSTAVGNIAGIVIPILIMGVIIYFLFRMQTRGASDIFSFGKSRAKLFAKGKQHTTFKDVAGVDEAKKELVEIVDFLKHPAKYKAIGARTPKGVLLFGPAGVGKTLLAKAVAGEANVPFFSMAGSEFMEMLVGVGASRVRDLFGTAKTAAPSIIFIDEIDAIGRQRGRSGMVGGHDEREQTLNQILVEMDGFTPNDNVIVMAATNRGDLLDPALLRPGRFDRRVTLDMPDKEGRKEILQIHSANKKVNKNVNWDRVADRTVGFSGADLENMLNEAAIAAARADKKELDMEDIEEAATKVKMGPARKRLQSAEDRKITAYHEGGHAIVTHALPGMDPVHRISIVARGMSLGHTLIPPAADRTHESKKRFIAQLAAMLGGRAAEETVFNDITAGASNDIEVATRLARAMVTDFGMSDLGPINMGQQTGYDDFGNVNWTEATQVSPALQEKIDNEVKKLMDKAHKEALVIVKKERKMLDKVAAALLKKETLDRDDFEKIVGKNK
ncbi:ATP-dependent zinc metalloprotease FtsH [soil metagenome]